MAYGVLMKNETTGETVEKNKVSFYPTERSSIGTSDIYHFFTVNFTSQSMNVSFGQYGSLLSSTVGSPLSNINFDLNFYGFSGFCHNYSRPTLIELCEIKSYESGIGRTVLANDFTNQDKYIRNYTDPANIYVRTEGYPISLSTSYFGNSLQYLLPSSNVQNFTYVKYSDDYGSKNFLAVPSLESTVSWVEIPSLTFYCDTEYFLTNSDPNFDGTSIKITSFKNIIPEIGASILINNINFNDELSGVYVIVKITNVIQLNKSDLDWNYPGQIFNSRIDLDTSTNVFFYDCCYYVPYDYGYPAKTFEKSLKLTKYNTSTQSSSTFAPLYHDDKESSKLNLYLADKGARTKQSDSFVLGMGVSNWFPDSKLFGVVLNYEIKEGY